MIVIYASEYGTFGLRPFEIKDANGAAVASGPTEAAPATWKELFRGELPVGRYRAGGGGLLIVPAGTALP